MTRFGTGGCASAPQGNSAWAIRTLFLGAALIIWPQASLAQSSGAIAIGSVVQPIALLPLRDAPPEGLLGAKGETVGEASPDHSYRVLNEKTINTVLSRQTWLYVQDITSRQTGWVYSGSDDRPFQNVTKHKTE